MPTETFKTDYGNIPKLTENNYPIWQEKVPRVLMGADAYYIVTSEEPALEGKTANSRTRQHNWHTQRNDAPAIIYMEYSDEILPHIRNTTDLAEMKDILSDHFDNTRSKLGRTQILRKFHASRPTKDKKMNTYYTPLIDYHNQLSGSAEEISEDGFVTHRFTHTEGICHNDQHLRATSPASHFTTHHGCHSIGRREGGPVTEITDASTGAALYSQREAYRGRGRGASVRDLDDKRRTDAPTARWTITPPKHAASGSALTAATAILAEKTALEETILEETIRKRGTTVRSQAI